MSDEALVSRNDAVRRFDFTPVAIELRDNALAAGALINKVANTDDLKLAVLAQTGVASVLKLVESARKAAKEPVLDFGRLIDDKAREFIKELKQEELRLARLAADWEQLEQARIRAARQAEDDRLRQIERDRAAEMAKAQSHEQLDKIAEKFDQKAKDEAPAPTQIQPRRVEGQTVREEWDFEVTDVWALARAHPMCVTVEARRAEIKSLLNAGHKVTGIRSWKVTKAGVRVRTSQAIEV
jgi:hypothetical protein